ncbi:MAG: hypothetical protein ABJK39_03240 [Hyphomicrobiales bacterium]
MADESYQFSPLGFVKTVAFTAVVAGLSYWLWQDIKPLMRPFKGDFWAFAKDLNILVNGAGLFLLVTAAGMVFDHGGSPTVRKRLIVAALMIALVVVLIVYGRFYSKEIWPFLTSLVGN